MAVQDVLSVYLGVHVLFFIIFDVSLLYGFQYVTLLIAMSKIYLISGSNVCQDFSFFFNFSYSKDISPFVFNQPAYEV